MRKYTTSQLLMFSLFILLIVSAMLADKAAAFKNMAVISFGCMFFVKGRDFLRAASKDEKWKGRALIFLSIGIVTTLLTKTNNTYRLLCLAGFFSAAGIYLVLWSKHASQKTLSCTLWLLFFSPIISFLILAIIDTVIDLKLVHIILIFTGLYCACWFLMAKYGQQETTQRATLFSGLSACILLMLLIFTSQVAAPILETSFPVSMYIKPAHYLGYTYKDISSMLIYLLTFPVIILSIISYIIASNRKRLSATN